MEDVREYPPVVRLEENDGKRYFRTTFKEFPGLIGGVGGDVNSSIESAYGMLEAEIEFRKEMGLPIPKPVVSDLLTEPSGRVTLRMSKTQHRQLIQVAEEEGVSINSLINEAITMRLTFSTSVRSCNYLNIDKDYFVGPFVMGLGIIQRAQTKSTSDRAIIGKPSAQA